MSVQRKYVAMTAPWILAARLGMVVNLLSAQPDATRPASDDPALRLADYQPSGDYYDWRRTGRPERPWFHKYDQGLVMKIFLAERTDEGRGCKVYLTFEQALEVIERLDRITCGAPKIVYLVGWQYNGHDSKYPAWGEVNHRLKRAQGATALESLKWLMREGRRHHTIVSLHINALDAYEDSPLWQEYLEKDIIAKDKRGAPLKGIVWSGLQSYPLSYAREWETGCAKRRIDGLLKMLPDLKEAHTVHIDAFHTYPPLPPASQYEGFKGISPFLGYGPERECAAQRKTLRYFRDCGLDVTSEHSTGARLDAFVGLQPMAWIYELPAPDIPPSLYCGTPMRAEAEIRTDQRTFRACWISSACRRPRKSGPMPRARRTTTTHRWQPTGSSFSRGTTVASPWSGSAVSHFSPTAAAATNARRGNFPWIGCA